jgi:hypothetical protein
LDIINQFKGYIVCFIGLLVLVQSALGTAFFTGTEEFCRGINNSLRCAESIERSRLPKHKGFIERKGNKLRLYLSNGHVVELRNLTDEECAKTEHIKSKNAGINDICHYTFWDFLRPVDYYLVFNQYWEGIGFSLVSRKTERMFLIDDFPNLSPDNKRFVTVDIEDAYTKNRIQIWKFTSSGISLEWTYKPEGYWVGTDAEWIDNRSIRITYRIPSEKGELPMKYFAVMLDAKGWQILGRAVPD